jgi:glycine hydroxymethyltransferase
LAIQRAIQLFGAEDANVQPHSGSQANMAVYMALLKPGDIVLGMDLAHGGHLTHGAKASFSGQYYQFKHYGVNKDTGRIDHGQLRRLAREHKPKMIVAGASAYPRILEFDIFAEIAQEVGAFLMVDMAHIAGLVATELHPSPINAADVVTSTTHKTLRGPRGGLILSKADIAQKIRSAVFPGIQGGPLMHVIAAKALAFKEALAPSFRDYQKQVLLNAQALAEALQAAGLKLVSDGTDNHLILVDLTSWEVTGKDAEIALHKAGITVNKNAVPFDQRGPALTSGIRLGTPYLTTRGMGADEMRAVAAMIVQVLKEPENTDVREKIQAQVFELCRAFPLYA